jgi:PTS system fructose-specific IIC component
MGNNGKALKIVSVTACQAGIAHTYLCAEALADAAKEMGHQIKIETMGSIGAENVLTDDDIAEADLIFLAVEINIHKERFAGKPIFETGTHEVAVDPKKVLNRAITWLDEEYDPSEDEVKVAEVAMATAENAKKSDSKGGGQKKGGIGKDLYRHLMSGVSYIIPFVVAGGIIQALAIATSGANPAISAIFGQIGGHAFGMMVPIMAAFMAYSVADRPGLVPGMVAGFMAIDTGSGFIGAILGGYIAGYSVKILKDNIKLKGGLKAMMPILILPLISTLITGFAMKYVVGIPVGIINTAMTNYLNGLSDGGASAIVLGALLGWMITGDFGGILCRVSYGFAVASLATGEPSVAMASTMAGGLITGLSITAAALLFPKKFTLQERDMAKTGWIMGMSFIVESGIPFAARDPKVQFPAHGIGGAITGALTAAFGCAQVVPHGGFWVMPIPGAIINVPGMLIAVAVGTAFATVYMGIFKKVVS